MHTATQPTSLSTTRLIPLVAGDVVALLAFVIVGRLSHGLSGDWLLSVARIAMPFLLGWFILAILVGAYRGQLSADPGRFLQRSALAWLPGISLGFVLRAVLFRNNVTFTFALATLAFTGIFLLGWRGIFVWWIHRGG